MSTKRPRKTVRQRILWLIPLLGIDLVMPDLRVHWHVSEGLTLAVQIVTLVMMMGILWTVGAAVRGRDGSQR